MAIEDIKKELEKRFAEPLDEFYKRRIIFWNDEEGEFASEVESLSLCNAKILLLNDHNQFVSKMLLNEDVSSNYLVYNPLTSDKESDWFYDMKLYSENFSADAVSRYMQEMNVEDTLVLRNVVKQYQSYFNAVKRRELIKGFNEKFTSATRLHMAVVSAICGLDEIDYKDIIQTVLMDGEDVENPLKLELLKYGASDTFWKMVAHTTGYSNDTNLDHLFVHILLSAITKTTSLDLFSGLEDCFNSVQNTFCYELIYDWMKDEFDCDLLLEMACVVEDHLQLRNRLMKYSILDLSSVECLPCVDEVILHKMMEDVENNVVNISDFISVIECRRTCGWFSLTESYYGALLEVVHMFQFYEEHCDGFHEVSAKKVWDLYTSDYYRMDSYYRLFQVAFNKCVNDSNEFLDDMLKRVFDVVENVYKSWFLDKLACNWNVCCEGDLSNFGYISGVDLQKDFYSSYIMHENKKCFVIVSDALRYEVAASLLDKLKLSRCEVQLKSLQSVFPSITKFGMAALLPKNEWHVVNRGNRVQVLLDGKPSEMSDRDGILKSYNSNSVAFKYSDFMQMSVTARKNAIKGMEVVYIYHDVIDGMSHTNELGVCEACDTAIDEIENLVRIITGMSGVQVYITADHGFLYTAKRLEDMDKMDRFSDCVVEQERRYILSDRELDDTSLMSVKGFYNGDGIYGYAPRENIRVKGWGSQNFVHGGVSLQELVVPVIDYKFLRKGYKSYQVNRDKIDTRPVSIDLLATSHKISNMIFNLRFFQKEFVGNNFVPCSYDVFFTDCMNNLISDVQTIVADKSDVDSRNREIKCTFRLKQQQYKNSDVYYLNIVDKDRIQVPIQIEFQIDIAMAFDDFDF